MLSLLLPALASVNVNLAILTYQSDARFTSAETCVAEWVNGTCWLAEPMQAVVAAALTAVTDFNARDAVALPVLGSLGACDKQLQFRLLDSGGTAAKSVRALGDLSGTDVVIGAVRSTVTATTAAITGALDIPQISYWSTSTDLRDPILFPRFMRTIPSSLAPASDLCSFWKDELGLSTVAVLYMQTTYGRAYEEAAKDACLGLGLTFLSRDIPDFFEGSSSQQSIRSAVASLSESGAKAVLVLASKPVLEFIVEVALDTGLLRAGVSWVFADSVVPEQLDDLSEKARAALNGSLSIKAVGATDGNLQWTKFANERWATLEPGDFNPSLPADWQIRGDFFSTVDPHTSTVLRNGGAFAYDAIIAAGLLACEVAPMGKVPASFGTQFWASKKSLSFDGLTGRVQFDEKGDRGNANVLLFNLRDQGGFSEKRVAQFNNGTCTWDGGSRESSGVIFNFGKVEPPFDASPPPPLPPPLPPSTPPPPLLLEDGENGLPPYLLVIIGVLASVGLMLCLCCLPVGRLVPPLSRIAASHGTNPWTLLRRRISRCAPVRFCVGCARAVRRACSWARTTPFLRPTATPRVVWERLCRRANKEPAEGPPDIERRPFVEQRLWASVLEQRLWGTAAREAAQLRAYLHVTRNTTPFIEACVEKLLSRGGTAACTQRSCNDDGCEASPDLEAPRLLRTISAPLVEQSRATLKMRDLLRFCLNEQGAGGRQLWEEWKIALCDLRSKERHRDASVHRDSASRQALRSLLDPRARGSSEAEPISVHESEPISVHEFASLLLSPCNSAIEQRSATEDATEPLTSYWIASSHNSFLEGDQLTSAVSADMYRRLLLSGTRCLEIDCWDPTTFGRWCGQGPRVTHRMPGGVSLLCGSVAFGEVVAAIAEHAFTSSPLPVILSIEMHCSAKQQKKIAKELVNTLGDLLSRSEHAASTPLRDLHRKVLIKMRLDKGGVTTDESLRDLVTLPTASIGSSPPVEDDSGRRLGRMASWKELSGRSLHRGVWGWLRSKRDGDSRATQMSECSLGSLSSTCLHRGSSIAEEPTSELSGARVPRRGIVSLSEERLERLVSEQGGWLPLTASQLVRTFPSPTRWWSSNNSPLAAWRAGVQMVALNLQTNDALLGLPVQLHDALFRGSGGYVLKPAALRAPDRAIASPVHLMAPEVRTATSWPNRSPLTPSRLLFGSGSDLVSGESSLGRRSSVERALLQRPSRGNSVTGREKLWPPPREEVHRTELRVLSLHRLPTRDECRPLLAEPHHAFVSHLSDSPRPPSGARASVSSPRVCVELHAIGGFHAIAREPQPPPEAQGVTRLVTAVAEGNGLNPTFDETFHCLAAEPHQTILRVVVEDEGRLVAYETAMLGSLRCGYRCLHLRSPSGTRIDACCLLLHISVSTEPNVYGTVDELRSRVQSQRSRISQQSRDIHHLSAELSRLGSQSSSPALSPSPSRWSARWPLELALDAGVNGARAGRPSPIALPPGATLTVGRDASSGVALVPQFDTQRVSRFHASLHVAADGRSVRLEDVSRKYGCRVQQPGGEPVVLQSTAEEVASAQLREGSVLTFGQSDAEDEFRYVLRAAGTLSKDSDDSSCDGDNERERAWPPLLPPPSLPPPSPRTSSSSPLVPPKLRTRPSGPRPLAFYAGAGISPASAPQQRRCVPLRL